RSKRPVPEANAWCTRDFGLARDDIRLHGTTSPCKLCLDDLLIHQFNVRPNLLQPQHLRKEAVALVGEMPAAGQVVGAEALAGVDLERAGLLHRTFQPTCQGNESPSGLYR